MPTASGGISTISLHVPLTTRVSPGLSVLIACDTDAPASQSMVTVAASSANGPPNTIATHITAPDSCMGIDVSLLSSPVVGSAKSTTPRNNGSGRRP